MRLIGTLPRPLPEADYRAFGYEPDFDGLPWKGSYNAEKEAAVEGAVLDGCSEPPMFKETDPILGTRDIQRAIAFYTQQLGFQAGLWRQSRSTELRRVSP
jgi:hypothetical protein